MSTDEAPRPGGLLRRRDRFFHEPRYRDWNWVETNWFSFLVPERRLCGHARALFRPTLGVAESNVFAYSGAGAGLPGVLGMDVHEDRHAMPMPPANLDRYALPNGLSVVQTAPFERWEVRYDGLDGTVFDLRLEALMPPVEVGETAVAEAGEGFGSIQRSAPDLSVGHIDQTLWVEGHVEIGGERIAVDFAANRDHSWGPRRENVARFGCGNFDDGHFGRDFHFLVQTRNDSLERGEVTHGYLLDRGEVLRLKRGEGRYELDGHRTVALVYEVEDERGCEHRFAGEPLAIVEKVSTNSYSCNGVTRWTRDGETGWGEYRWHWGVAELRRRLLDDARAGTAPPPAQTKNR